MSNTFTTFFTKSHLPAFSQIQENVNEEKGQGNFLEKKRENIAIYIPVLIDKSLLVSFTS